MTQRFTGTAPTTQRGADLTIWFSNEALAGTTVTVTITDEDSTTATVDIKLDATGEGSAVWSVPTTWGGAAILSHSTSDDFTVAVG